MGRFDELNAQVEIRQQQQVRDALGHCAQALVGDGFKAPFAVAQALLDRLVPGDLVRAQEHGADVEP